MEFRPQCRCTLQGHRRGGTQVTCRSDITLCPKRPNIAVAPPTAVRKQQSRCKIQIIQISKPTLKDFEIGLNASQEAFGKVFGEYTRRQIHAYETGESEIPIALLLAIRDKGIPWGGAARASTLSNRTCRVSLA